MFQAPCLYSLIKSLKSLTKLVWAHFDVRLRQALDALGGGSLAVSAGVVIDGDGHAFDPRQDGKFGETVFVDQRPDRFELKELAGRQNSFDPLADQQAGVNLVIGGNLDCPTSGRPQ